MAKTELTERIPGKPRNLESKKGPARSAEQASLWPAQQPPATESNSQPKINTTPENGRPSESPKPTRVVGRREISVIQDLLLPEGLLAAKLSADATTLDDLQGKIEASLRQNSSETRRRYAQSVVRWFFSDGLDGLARKVWATYLDERVESDILRHAYLSSEPIMGACVAEALFPLQEGIVIPPGYFDRFLGDYLGAQPTPKTRKRVKMNLVKLGFLKPARNVGHRLNPVTQTKTAFLVLLHHLFAPLEPRTIELRYLFANPFWKYLGFKSEDAVRGVIREANASGLLGKYVVADELEQITTCLTLADILGRGIRL